MWNALEIPGGNVSVQLTTTTSYEYQSGAKRTNLLVKMCRKVGHGSGVSCDGV